MRRLRSSLILMFRMILLTGLVWAGSLQADSFRVLELSAESEEQAYQLQAQIEYKLSAAAEEALVNGVPITIEVHLQLRRMGAWIWEEDILDQRLRFVIRFQALGEVYEVTSLQSGSKQNFSTQAAALKALGNLAGVPLVMSDQLTKGESYRLSVRAKLDMEALPLPLRPFAYLDPQWRLESKWKEWRLNH